MATFITEYFQNWINEMAQSDFKPGDKVRCILGTSRGSEEYDIQTNKVYTVERIIGDTLLSLKEKTRGNQYYQSRFEKATEMKPRVLVYTGKFKKQLQEICESLGLAKAFTRGKPNNYGNGIFEYTENTSYKALESFSFYSGMTTLAFKSEFEVVECSTIDEFVDNLKEIKANPRKPAPKLRTFTVGCKHLEMDKYGNLVVQGEGTFIGYQLIDEIHAESMKLRK